MFSVPSTPRELATDRDKFSNETGSPTIAVLESFEQVDAGGRVELDVQADENGAPSQELGVSTRD
jgi:hypothetical protein